MADFFYDLAAKNLGTANVVKPRPSALFESTAMPERRSVAGDESVNTSDDVRLVESRPLNRPQRTSPRVERSLLTSDDSDLIPTHDAVKSSHDPEDTSLSPRISRAAENVELNRRHEQILSRPLGLPVEESKAAGQPETHDQYVKPKPLLPVPNRSSEKDPLENDKQDVAEKTQIVAKPRVAVSEAHTREALSQRDASNTTTKSLETGMEIPAVPVINVTIGRVEVRAMPALPPQRAAQAKPATASLDEYLQRRRNGGAR